MRFGFCVHVLQKHWRLTCQHGEPGATTEDPRTGERWHDLGDIDPVKAILLRNA